MINKDKIEIIRMTPDGQLWNRQTNAKDSDVNGWVDSNMWERLKAYAKTCSWSAGTYMAHTMRYEWLQDWESVFIAVCGESICGYCTVSRTDCIPNVEYTPYIGFMFVGEEFRGHRLSERLIRNALEYLDSIGFDKTYLVSDHDNLYEKYGFEIIDRKVAPWGTIEKIYQKWTK